MTVLLKVLGWTLRASAAVCMTFIVVSVMQGADGYRTLPELLTAVSYHAVFALSGTQLVGLAHRRSESRKQAAATTA